MKKLFNTIRSRSFKEMLREYGWLIRYSLHYKKEVLWYLFVGALGTALSLAGSILSKYIIDTVTGFNTGDIVIALTFFVLMQLSQILIHAVSSRINAKVSLRVNQQITAQVYDKLLTTDWEALSPYHSGDLLSRINGDVSTVSSSVLSWFPELLTKLLQFAGTLAVILYFDATLALLALLSAPATLLMGRYAVEKMRYHSKEMRRLSSQMTVFSTESFQHIQLLKSFDRTDAYSQKHRALQQQLWNAAMDYNRFSIRKTTVLSLASTAVALVCFSWSIYRLWSGHITYGTMTLFLQLFGSLTGAFSALTALIPGAINAATAAGRIMVLMELPDEDRGERQAAEAFLQKCGSSALTVEAKDLTYFYEDGMVVLKGSSFVAEAGQIVSIKGPSGEGKTTLLRLLLGIVQPKEGSLILRSTDGDSIAISPSTRSLFAYVPQGNTMFSGTVGENLRLIRPEATDEQLFEVLRLACAEDFVQQLPLGLNTPIQEHGGFSEGQLQRLCIARALLSDAPILLLDEATSALDMDTEQQVLHNILQSRQSRTCIITTHRPSVLELSHRIYRIRKDKIESVK